MSLSSIRSHFKQDLSVPVKDVIITDECRSTIKQAFLEGFILCDKKFPRSDFVNPPYPTIIILLGGGHHGVIRINISVELQQNCKYINTLIFETLAKIYLGCVASSIVSFPTNTILHPIENVDGDFSIHVCTKRNYGYCAF